MKEKGFLSLASAFEDMAAPNYCDLQTDDQLSKAFLNAIAFLAYYSVYYSLNSKLARAHQMDDLEAIRTNKDALISIPDQALIDAIQIAFTSFLPILETLPPDTPFKRTMITLVQNNPAHTFVHNGEFKPCSA